MDSDGVLYLMCLINKLAPGLLSKLSSGSTESLKKVVNHPAKTIYFIKHVYSTGPTESYLKFLGMGPWLGPLIAYANAILYIYCYDHSTNNNIVLPIF